MKKVLFVMLNILAMATVAACSKGGSGKVNSDFKPVLDTNTSCKIRVVGDYSKFEALVAEFHRFRYFYPHVSFSYKQIEDYRNSITDLLTGANKPNIFFTYSSMIGDTKFDAMFSHAEDLSKTDIDFSCIRNELIHKEDDSVYMVPVFARTYGMLVNNTLFEKEGLQVPQTYQELANVCTVFKEKEYASPIMGYADKSSGCLMNTIAYPLFLATIKDRPDIIELANNKDPQAGEYTRDALTVVKSIIDNGYVNLDKCSKEYISDNYAQVIERFFKGDAPMMVCTADTACGTTTREDKMAYQFNYSFAPFPGTNDGGYLIDSPSVEFAVNKECDNLDMTNEFMRFLISNKELNELSAVKGLLPPTKTFSYDSLYAPIAIIPEERRIFSEVLGIKDTLASQIREASFKVGKGELTIDQAVAQYGSF